MLKYFIIALVGFATTSYAQTQPAILVIDFVKVINGNHREAAYFYKNNWKVYREIAERSGFIKSWQLLTTHPDSTANFDIMLITEYTDSVQLALSEDRFREIIKAASPNGPKLLNDLKPKEFRNNVFLKRARRIYSSGK